MKKILFIIFSFILNINIFATEYIKEEFFIEKYSLEREVSETFDKDGNLIKSFKAKLPYTEDVEAHTKISYINDLHTITESKSTNNKINIKIETKYKKKPEPLNNENEILLENFLNNPFETAPKAQNILTNALSNIEYQYSELSQIFNGVKMFAVSKTDAESNTHIKIYVNDMLHTELFTKAGKPVMHMSYLEDNKKMVVNYKDDFSFITSIYDHNILISETFIDFDKNTSITLVYEDDKVAKITVPVFLDKAKMEMILSGTMRMELYDKNGNLLETAEHPIEHPVREKIFNF